MTVNELVAKVEESKKLKRDYNYSKHLIMSYMPYAEKSALVKGIIDSTSYDNVNGMQIYRRDTKTMLFVFTLKLIERYTDIAINVEDITSEYDTLMSTGIMNGLMSQIPEEEISILRGMLDMERDDLEVNTRSLISFFESKADALKVTFGSISNVLEDPKVKAKLEELTK